MTTIIGVDFSGAEEEEGKTWAAQGRLSDDGSLRLDSVLPVLREDLYELLARTAPPAVVAMDFPFGVPAAFAEYICGSDQPSKMPDVWRRVACMGRAKFIAAREAFVPVNGEPKRVCDKYYLKSFSPLHKVNPNMVPMTYEGICLLHRWHQNDSQRWYVPPLPATDGPERERVTLLEVMPGMLLKGMDLPFNGYKTGQQRLELRTAICDGLEKASEMRLPNLASFRNGCRANDDCLDAVVAAVGAAMWARDAGRFLCPTGCELKMAKLEGCIFAPLPRA